MMSIAKLAWVSVAAGLLVAGVAVAGSVQDKTVQITEKGYMPDRIEVLVGQKVVFQNATQKDHTVTSSKPAGESEQDKDKREFDSGVIKPGTSWEHTFSKEGTYSYHCKEDKLMTGTIVVASAK
jgi:plastocyanin